jgi:membrane protein required for colicin V production
MEGLPVNVTDLGIIAILVISGLLAFARGFLREVLSVGAWIGAAAATIYGLEPARPFLRQYINEPLIADGITGLVIFVLALGVLSTLSHFLSRNVRDSALGALDRSLGLLFGLLRGAVVVCALWLVFELLVAPADRPDWITEARSLPLVEAGSRVIVDLLPGSAVEKGAEVVDEAGRQLEEEAQKRALEMSPLGGGDSPPESPPATDSQTGDPAANPAAPAEGSGYKDQERQDMNRLIQGTQ